jgi:heme exporter protein D
MDVLDVFLALSPEARFGFSAFAIALLLLISTQIAMLAIHRRRERLTILSEIQTELRVLTGRQKAAQMPGRRAVGLAPSRPVRRVQRPRRVGKMPRGKIAPRSGGIGRTG